MKKTMTVLLLTVLTVLGIAVSGRAEARPRVVVPVPAVRLGIPVELVAVPGTPVWFYAAAGADVFWYAGVWWMPYEGRWYRSASVDGPWVYVTAARIPYAVRHLPRNPRHVYATAPRIAYGRWYNERHGHRHYAEPPRRVVQPVGHFGNGNAYGHGKGKAHGAAVGHGNGPKPGKGKGPGKGKAGLPNRAR